MLNRLKTVKSSLKGRSNPKVSWRSTAIAMLMMTMRSVLVQYMMIQAL